MNTSSSSGTNGWPWVRRTYATNVDSEWLAEHDREIREDERKRCADIAQSFERDLEQYGMDLRAGISIDWLEGADDAARAITAAILEDGIK